MKASLFNTLTARKTATPDGLQTELLTPSGAVFATIASSDTQPRYMKQKYISIGQTYYRLTWQMTPQTPILP